MSIIKRIAGFFRKPKNELQVSNQACNVLFESVFQKCRFDFGREMISLMELKKDIMDKGGARPALTQVQEFLAKQMIDVISAYFKMAESLSAVKSGKKHGESVEEFERETMEKMNRAMTVATTLHRHIIMKTGHTAASAFKDQFLLDEAEALCKVLDKEKAMKGK
jgi:hypothetical protein